MLAKLNPFMQEVTGLKANFCAPDAQNGDEVKEFLVASGWYDKLAPMLESDVYANIKTALKEKGGSIYPNNLRIFRAFFEPKFDDVKVVILGQDPYHGPKQAIGLSFAVENGTHRPPSLVNILKEVETNCKGFVTKERSDLYGWQRQGVMLLNSVLTVEPGKPASHKDIGWQTITDAAISALSKRQDPVIFMLWGKYAQQKKSLIDYRKHAILEAAHPSPYSAYSGFFGCKHFTTANEILMRYGKDPINWLDI